MGGSLDAQLWLCNAQKNLCKTVQYIILTFRPVPPGAMWVQCQVCERIIVTKAQEDVAGEHLAIFWAIHITV